MTDSMTVGLSGATLLVDFDDKNRMRVAIDHLLTCHPHHFAVVREQRSLLVSPTAVECLREADLL